MTRRIALGPGDDVFDVARWDELETGTRILGQAGADTIALGSPVFDTPSGLRADGGSGEDSLRGSTIGDATLRGGSGDDVIGFEEIGRSLLSGGSGDDTVAAGFGGDNTLEGGPGRDELVSLTFGLSADDGPSLGSFMQGGPGRDSFRILGSSDLALACDGGGGDLVSDGDVVVGWLDVIADYRQGEELRLGNAVTTRVEEVAVGVDIAGTRFPDVADGEYAFLRGRLDEAEGFVVDGSGPDLLAIFQDPEGFIRGGEAQQGVVVLLGVTNPDLVTIA